MEIEALDSIFGSDYGKYWVIRPSLTISRTLLFQKSREYLLASTEISPSCTFISCGILPVLIAPAEGGVSIRVRPFTIDSSSENHVEALLTVVFGDTYPETTPKVNVVISYLNS